MVVVLLKNDLEFLTVEKFSRIFLLALKNSRCASFKGDRAFNKRHLKIPK